MKPIYNCAWPEIVQEYFENSRNEQKLLEYAQRVDIEPVEFAYLLSKDKFAQDPRRPILENVACYADSIDQKIRLIGEWVEPKEYFTGDLGKQYEMPKPLEQIVVPGHPVSLFIIPHDKRLMVISSLAWKWLRIRFPFVDSEIDFRKENGDYDIDYKIHKQYWTKGRETMPYDKVKVENDVRLLLQLLFDNLSKNFNVKMLEKQKLDEHYSLFFDG